MRGIELVHQNTESGLIVSRIKTRQGAMPDLAEDWQECIRRQDFMRDIYSLLDRGREASYIRAGVPNKGFIVNTGASAIALAAATAKTVMYINSGAQDNASVDEICIGFDGVTSLAVPGLVEVVYGTKATNSTPGTNSTSFTPIQTRGWAVQTSAAAAANTCTSEPTVLTTGRMWLLTPNGGLLVIQFPLTREPTAHNIASTSGLQFGLRCTVPAIVNTRGYIEFEE